MEGFSLGAVAGACPGAAAAAVGAVASRREKGVSVAAVAAGNREVVGLEAAVEEEVVGRGGREGLGGGRVRREGPELEVGRVQGGVGFWEKDFAVVCDGLQRMPCHGTIVQGS